MGNILDRYQAVLLDMNDVFTGPLGTGRAVLFGGCLRDLALQGASAVPRDIDVVYVGVEPESVADALRPYIERRIRFGGLQLNRGAPFLFQPDS
jgi:hypothetical protein